MYLYESSLFSPLCLSYWAVGPEKCLPITTVDSVASCASICRRVHSAAFGSASAVVHQSGCVIWKEEWMNIAFSGTLYSQASTFRYRELRQSCFSPRI